MKHLTLNIPDKKYPFFLELVKNLDFITLGDEPKTKGQLKSRRELKAKHPLQQNIEQGLKEVALAKKGKLKGTPLNEFLNEL